MGDDVRSELQVTSHAQAEAWGTGRVAAAEKIDEGWWALALPIAEGTLASSFGYALMGADGVHVIDPGWASDETFDYWRTFLAEHGRRVQDIETILVTHSHPDHLGLAGRLREASGATVMMTAAESAVLNDVAVGMGGSDEWMRVELLRWGVPDHLHSAMLGELHAAHFSTPLAPDRVIADGEEILLADRTLRAHVTPGHTDGHLCLEDPGAGLLFSGDHVLPRIYSGIGLGQLPGSEPLGAYLRSLSRISELDQCEVLPGHEFRFRGLRLRCAQIAAHHLRRTAAVQEVDRRMSGASVWDVTGHLLWTRGWDNLRGFERQSALRQTELHLAAVRSGDAETWLTGGVISHAG
ncbi:MBL fold metallo-hydrolase [Glaciibacter psychrotolerans]|uniref:Glyoxylase-like metal-dependent hydrolase (Beta-lactamase superfamily II) n=1 Tax=Glaciibacter psychrotolerans TaxID=670054 RepID=A0A7Z0EFX1_9MICO|nr:MBL fold metallo-hydrolase [Leifsonia psychrotolerans]NYJ20485.1 glyoxylase-like metal-dependent hydrolase (beta-lactamase superfamily II) [Leifsonia psychrotolerans]